MSRPIRFALVGAGFIGRTHALALNAVAKTFPHEEVEAVPHILVEAGDAAAAEAARQLGFAEWTTDWRKAVDVADAVIVAVPSNLHREIAMHAIALSKPVLCEKPVGRSSAEAAEIAEAAAAAGVHNGVGFTYVRAPLVRHAKALLESGELGRPLHFAGRHNEDYLADPKAPHNWRLSSEIAGRCGALGDLGYHIVAIARFLCGTVDTVMGLTETFHKERPSPGAGSPLLPVENEDFAGALVRFSSGATGLIETSRIAHGRKMGIGFELVCEKGTIVFDGERMNELQVFLAGEPADRSGFKKILLGPAHPDYRPFLPAPGHGLGFNDLKTIEIAGFVRCISNRENLYPDLGEAAKIARVCEAIIHSSATGMRCDDPEYTNFNRKAVA